MDFIENNIKGQQVTRAFICEVHKIIVNGLPLPPNGEGGKNPGTYRTTNLRTNHSTHLPPDFLQVQDYMDELCEFVNRDDSPKYDFLKTALWKKSPCRQAI